ncbi:hypothetical protein [Enterococcus sp. BWR-S5]|uniref:hypothetical protein n=1 Tax=Enterococcus sp. BWR-S5 TaxID=2787714 RepID=UPI001920A7C2|nr:hypothetical protein [Enterococcus sp. BWR-S5]MBL1224776.1 hypothetical protein [Enterococcus sp. BWR-S5]
MKIGIAYTSIKKLSFETLKNKHEEGSNGGGSLSFTFPEDIRNQKGEKFEFQAQLENKFIEENYTIETVVEGSFEMYKQEFIDTEIELVAEEVSTVLLGKIKLYIGLLSQETQNFVTIPDMVMEFSEREKTSE